MLKWKFSPKDIPFPIDGAYSIGGIHILKAG
jgi:hypothetical protein